MKKFFYFIFICSVLCWGCTSSETEGNKNLLGKSERNIVLLHPTANNLKTFLYLTENKIFPLPNDYGIIGVYHSKEEYDYKLSRELIKNKGIKNISLVEISSELNPQNIFTKNDCSQQFKEIFNNSAGAIFFGGPDMPPACYGEETSLLTVITDPHRHYLELSFLFHLLGGSQDTTTIAFLDERNDYSILGICLGMQSMNVATGGTMVQDIPSETFNLNTVEQVLLLEPNQQHRNYHTNFGIDNNLIWGSFHQVKFEKGSILDSLNGFANQNPYILSSHHQCIETLGLNIVPVAWSLDGKIIEAVKHSKFPNVIGVQFHPEPTFLYEANEKFSLQPNQAQKESYLNTYPGEKGELFHRAFWKYIGKIYQ